MSNRRIKKKYHKRTNILVQDLCIMSLGIMEYAFIPPKDFPINNKAIKRYIRSNLRFMKKEGLSKPGIQWNK